MSVKYKIHKARAKYMAQRIENEGLISVLTTRKQRKTLGLAIIDLLIILAVIGGIQDNMVPNRIYIENAHASLVSSVSPQGNESTSDPVGSTSEPVAQVTDGGAQAPPALENNLKKIAKKEGIDWRLLWAVCQVESQCNSNRIGDGGQSYGAFQIYLPAHPNITKEQAMDFGWAAEWTAKHGLKYANNPAMFFKNHNGIAKTTNQWYVDNALDKYNQIATMGV